MFKHLYSIKLQWRTLSVLISCRVQFVHEFEAYPKSAPIPGLYAACIFVSVLNFALTSKHCWYPNQLLLFMVLMWAWPGNSLLVLLMWAWPGSSLLVVLMWAWPGNYLWANVGMAWQLYCGTNRGRGLAAHYLWY